MAIRIEPAKELPIITVPIQGPVEERNPIMSFEVITIPDECGDSLWDVDLGQEGELKD